MTPFEELRGDIEQYVARALAGFEARKVRAPKVVRDACAGLGRLRPYECNVLDLPLMQRLRYIHQTALAYLTYPCARHTRFEHSLGCMITADRVWQAMRDRAVIPDNRMAHAQVRLAGLLHDCGHVPFSHASEPLVAQTALFSAAAQTEGELFDSASPHEILSYLIVRSPAFKQTWSAIADLYTIDEAGDLSLDELSMDAVADLIIGRPPAGDTALQYVADIINGPLDCDKLDYMQRDGLFTGLGLRVDLDRLMYTLAPVKQGDTDATKVLAIHLSGVPCVEQLLFNRMQLFSSVYHHHKVRVGLHCAQALIRELQGASRAGLDATRLEKPSDFLQFHDDALIAIAEASQVPELCAMGKRIRNRDLLKRVLVLSGEAISPSTKTVRRKYARWIWGKGRGVLTRAELGEFEKELGRRAGVDPSSVFFDIPRVPILEEAGEATIDMGLDASGNRQLGNLRDVCSTGNWSNAYGTFKHRSYILGPDEGRRALAKAAVPLLEELFGLIVSQKALDEAKHDPPVSIDECRATAGD